MKRLFKILLGFFLVGLVGCNSNPLVPLGKAYVQPPDTGTALLNFCTSVPKPAKVETDYVFIVDMSSSNKQNCLPDNGGYGLCKQPLTLVAGTNISGIEDFGAIESFLTGLQAADPNDPLNYYALIEFATGAGTNQNLTNNYGAFKGLIDNEYAALNFGGWTDYMSSLDQLAILVNGIISKEATNLSQNKQVIAHNVVVIFTTDGAPLIPLATNPNTPVLQDETAIVNQITGIEQLVESNSEFILSLQFNAVFYYTTLASTASTPLPYTSYSPGVVSFLTAMTKAGNGRLFNVVSGSVPDYSAFIIPPLNEPNTFADLYVHDMNMAWAGPKLNTATDGMMADNLRLSLGAPPATVAAGQTDSDRNGVSDLVEYLTTGKICNDPACAPGNATQYKNKPICINFKVAGSNPIRFTRGYIPLSIFNDCELALMNANLDGTGVLKGTTIPQDIAAVMGYSITITSPVDWVGASAFNDGFNPQQRIKLDVDPFINANQLIYEPYVYDIKSLGPNANNQMCYSASVSHITLSTLANDTIMAYLVQTSSNSSLPTVRVGSKQMSTSATIVTFDDADLQ